MGRMANEEFELLGLKVPEQEADARKVKLRGPNIRFFLENVQRQDPEAARRQKEILEGAGDPPRG